MLCQHVDVPMMAFDPVLYAKGRGTTHFVDEIDCLGARLHTETLRQLAAHLRLFAVVPVALCLEGKDAIAVVRRLVGATNSREADPGTIRGDFGMSFSNNLVHASDGPDTAATELALRFPDAAELSDWELADLGWTYNVAEELS